MATKIVNEDMKLPSAEAEGSGWIVGTIVAEAGKRVAKAQVDALQKIQAEVASLLRWASYTDGDGEQSSESYQSLRILSGQVEDAFYSAFVPAGQDHWTIGIFVMDIFQEHPDLGDALIVRESGAFFSVSYATTESGIAFAPRNDWVKVIPTYLPVPVETAEADVAPIQESASGAAIAVIERAGEAALVPLTLDVALIRPGWGNQRDGFYYPAEMLEACQQVFAEAKMYETDHRAEEKSTRTWVSTVKSVKGLHEDGSVIGEVVIHDPTFAQKVLALSEAGLIHKLECSILAQGTARKGKIEDKSARVVESINQVDSVDWVTRAGAGGRALRIAESDAEDEAPPVVSAETDPAHVQEDETPPESVSLREGQPLSRESVAEILSTSRLPEPSRARLAEATYPDRAALDAAVSAETEYVKRLTGSGQPFAQGASAPASKSMSEAEKAERFNHILERHGGMPVKIMKEVFNG